MNPLILLILAGVTGGLSQVIRKSISLSPHRATTITTATMLTNALFSLPLLFIAPQLPRDPLTWLLVILSAGIFSLAMTCLYKSYSTTDLSLVSILQRLNIIFTAIIGAVALQESLSLRDGLGILLLFFAGISALLGRNRINFTTGVFFAVAASILGAIASILDKIILSGFSPYAYVFINNLLVGSVFLIRKKTFTNSVILLKSHTKPIVISSLLGVTSFIMVLLVLSQNRVSVVMPVYKTVSFFIPVILGIIIFKEKQNLPGKIAGSVLAIIGIILLS